ncbi:hypothetical protein [Pedobacter sp. NJ-S-72]
MSERGISAAHSPKYSTPINSRDTQIDEILTKQGLKQNGSGAAKRSGSPLRRFLLTLFLVIGIAFILVYLMFRIKMK